MSRRSSSTVSPIVPTGLRNRFRALVAEVVGPRAAMSLRDALRDAGAEAALDATAIAELAWPAVRAALAAPDVRAWLNGLVSGFYDAEIAAASKPPAG